MLPLLEQKLSEDLDWQRLGDKLRAAVTLSAIVLVAWQMGLWVARAIVNQQLTERAQCFTQWALCPICVTQLHSKGFVKRRMLTRVGEIEWKRRVGRCPRHCLGSQKTPLDEVLEIQAHQQTSTELMRLGCLLAVFLPFDLASQLLLQLTGVSVSDDTIWNWVQDVGQRAADNLKLQLQQLADGQTPPVEVLDATLAAMPLIIAADGVTVPFRPQPKTPKGKIVWQEVKIALLARLGEYQTKAGKMFTRLHQRRLVAVLGNIDDYLKTHLEHIQYHQFKKQGLPIGSGMVESACKCAE